MQELDTHLPITRFQKPLVQTVSLGVLDRQGLWSKGEPLRWDELGKEHKSAGAELLTSGTPGHFQQHLLSL